MPISAKNGTTKSRNQRDHNKSKSDASNTQICLLNTYRVGDIVFVHLKGYNHWPAKILNIIEGKRERYSIEFFEFKARMATVFRSQITDFVSALRSETIKAQIRKNAMLNRYTKEAMVHAFGQMIVLE